MIIIYWTSDWLNLSLGERRVRVHTLCLPVVNQPAQIYASLNTQAISAVLAKMGKCTINIFKSIFYISGFY